MPFGPLGDSVYFSLLFSEKVSLDRSGGDSQVKEDKHSGRGCGECEHRLPGKQQVAQEGWSRKC